MDLVQETADPSGVSSQLYATQPRPRTIVRLDLKGYVHSTRIDTMARDPCDGCGTPVRIAGGIAGIWSMTHEPTGGMHLTFENGTEAFLCFACIEDLPTEPTEGDLPSTDESDS